MSRVKLRSFRRRRPGGFPGWGRVVTRGGQGIVVPGESFTGPAGRLYLDVNGIWQTVSGANVKRDPHYIGGVPVFLLEDARTNLELWCRDMTNAAWVKVTMTPAKDQVGIDGAANSASSLLATGANATCLQAIVDASKARYKSVFVKRLIGSGGIDMTMDNGVTWTPIATTGAWVRVFIPTQTLANPTVGFRIQVSGDKIAVDYSQCEDGIHESSPILTTVAGVTRAAEIYTMPSIIGQWPATVYAKWIEQGSQLSVKGIIMLGDLTTKPALGSYFSSATATTSVFNNGTASVLGNSNATGFVKGDTAEIRASLRADGSVQSGFARNGAAETLQGASTTQAFGTGWGNSLLYLNERTASRGFMGLLSFKVLSDAYDLLNCRGA